MALAARSFRPLVEAPQPRRAPGAIGRVPVPVARHPLPSRADLVAGPVLMAVTLALSAVTVVDTGQRLGETPTLAVRVAGSTLVVVISFLMASSSMYLLARQGALLRFRDHQPATRAQLDEHYDGSDAAVTVLVPSYAEEVPIVRATLWSAALQEFPRVRVVLLIDDHPEPTDEAAADRLEATRALPAELNAALAGASARHRAALEAFDRQTRTPHADDVLAVALEYEAAAHWIEDLAARQAVDDHVDRFYCERVLGGLARELRGTVTQLCERVPGGRCPAGARSAGSCCGWSASSTPR